MAEHVYTKEELDTLVEALKEVVPKLRMMG